MLSYKRIEMQSNTKTAGETVLDNPPLKPHRDSHNRIKTAWLLDYMHPNASSCITSRSLKARAEALSKSTGASEHMMA